MAKVRKSVNFPDIQFKDPDLARLMQFVRSQAQEIQRLQSMIAGGTLAQVLTKQSTGDYDATWTDANKGNITGAKNIGGGKPIFKDVEAGLIALRTLIPGDGITLTQTDAAITVGANIPPSGGGTVTSIGISSNDLDVHGSPVTTNGVIELEIKPKAVTYDKIQDTTADALLLGRNIFSGPGQVQELNISQALDMLDLGGAWGDIIFRGTDGWHYLPPGTSGEFLQTQGADADVIWAASTAGGTTTYFGTGAPSTLHNEGDLYFDTTSVPYQAYVQYEDPGVPNVPAVDTVFTTTAWAVGTTGTISVSATAAGAIILIIGSELPTSGSNPTVLSVVGSGLTFTQYHAINNGTTLLNGSNTNMEIWVASVAGPVSATTVTVTMTAASDNATLMGFSAKNLDALIFADGGVTGLPQDVVQPASSPPGFSGITLAEDDVLLYCVANAHNNSGTDPTGFTNVTTGAISTGIKWLFSRLSQMTIPSGGMAGGAVANPMGAGEPAVLALFALISVASAPTPAWKAVGGAGAASPLTTKGDIWGFSTVDARIPVGADGTFLAADSTATLGVSYKTPSGGGGTPYVPADPATILLHFNGANGQTTTVDSSSNAQAVTRVNSPVLSTTQTKFGATSTTVSAADGWTLPAGNITNLYGWDEWTVDFWLYMTGTTTTDNGILGQWANSGSGAAVFNWLITYHTTGHLAFYHDNSFPSFSGGAISSNAWHHIAVCRKGGYVYAYVDGAVYGTPITVSTPFMPFTVPTSPFWIGGLGGVIGFIDEVRVVAGQSLFNGPFTPPNAPYNPVSNAAVLGAAQKPPLVNTPPSFPTSGSSGWSGYSIIAVCKGQFDFINFATTWRARLVILAAAGLITNTVVLRCLAGSTTVIDSTAVSWGGVAGAQTLPIGVNYTDPIALQLDRDHDYYLVVHFDPAVSGSMQIGNQSSSGGNSFRSGFLAGDQTTLTSTSTLINAYAPGAYGWHGLFGET